MRALLHEPALVQHANPVGIADCGQPVCDHLGLPNPCSPKLLHLVRRSALLFHQVAMVVRPPRLRSSSRAFCTARSDAESNALVACEEIKEHSVCTEAGTCRCSRRLVQQQHSLAIRRVSNEPEKGLQSLESLESLQRPKLDSLLPKHGLPDQSASDGQALLLAAAQLRPRLTHLHEAS